MHETLIFSDFVYRTMEGLFGQMIVRLIRPDWTMRVFLFRPLLQK